MKRTGALLLAAPGVLWLGLFFVVPMFLMGIVSLESGSLEDRVRVHLAVLELRGRALRPRRGVRALVRLRRRRDPARAADRLPPRLRDRAAAGRWRNVLLFAVIAPFFTTYLIRTLAWQTILSDQSAVVDFLGSLGLLGSADRVLDTPASVIAGLTYNFLPFMILPIYATLERLDVRADRGRAGPLRVVAGGVLEGDAAAVGAGDRRRDAAHLHPGGRRLRQRLLPRRPEPGDDRQRDPGPVPAAGQLPDRGGALVRAHGADHGRGRRSTSGASAPGR